MTFPLSPQNSTILSPKGTMVASPPLVVRWELQLLLSMHPLQIACLQPRHQDSLSGHAGHIWQSRLSSAL